jgi:Uncharacterized protein predicted to be involved in DNA repair (RAMP superfamily)
MNYGWKYYRDYYHGVNLKNKVHDFGSQNKSFENTVINEVISGECGTYCFSLKLLDPGMVTESGCSMGIGLQSELKSDFFFDYTSGMPLIPAFLLKGTLRSVFPCYSEENSDNEQKAQFLWSLLCHIRGVNPIVFDKKLAEEPLGDKQLKIIRQIELEIFEGQDIGKELGRGYMKKPKYLKPSNRDIFFDVFPEKSSDNERVLALDSNNSIPFLKVLPETKWQFNFILNDGLYLTAIQKLELFRQIIVAKGLGEKTDLGYGHFENNPEDAKPKEIPSELFPEEIHDYLTKGSIFSGKVVSIIGEYFVITFEVEGELCQTRKNRANYSDLELDMAVSVECKNDYDIIKGSVQLGISRQE